MNEKDKFLLVTADDWQGLYKNGILITEDHTIELQTILKHLGIELEEKECDCNWIHERGNLPDKLKDVKF